MALLLRALGYVDGILILAPTIVKTTLEKYLRVAAIWCSQRGMKISPSKTTVMWTKRMLTEKLNLHETLISSLDSMVYLGVKFDKRLSF